MPKSKAKPKLNKDGDSAFVFYVVEFEDGTMVCYDS